MSSRTNFDDFGVMIFDQHETLISFVDRPDIEKFLLHTEDLSEEEKRFLTANFGPITAFEKESALPFKTCKNPKFMENQYQKAASAIRMKKPVLSKELYALSAVNFKAGRSNDMISSFLPILKRNYNCHLGPDTLSRVLNQSFCFSEHFEKEKLEQIYSLKGEFEIKWVPSLFGGTDKIFVPIMREINKTRSSGYWRPAHFLKERAKVAKFQQFVDDDIISLIAKRAVIILGSASDPKVLAYAKIISNLHVVCENRFDAVARTNKMRIRSCLDNFVLNSITKCLPYPMFTGEDVATSLPNIEMPVTFDNKASYYGLVLGPKCMPFMAFVWRDLVLTYTTPVFGLKSAPYLNELAMCTLKLRLHEVLKQNNLSFLAVISEFWVDDLIIAAAQGTIQKMGWHLGQIAPIIRILSWVFIELGITLNIRKSAFHFAKSAQYLGLQLFCKGPESFYQVNSSLIVNFVFRSINIFRLQDTSLIKKFTEQNFWRSFPLWTILTETERNWLNNQHISEKQFQQLHGAVMWCNKSFQLDSEIWPFLAIARHPHLKNNKFLLSLALKNILEIPRLLTSVVGRKQLPNSFKLFFYIKPHWWHQNRDQSLSWNGFPPLNIFQIFDIPKIPPPGSMGNCDGQHVIIRDGKLLSQLITLIWTYIEDIEPSTELTSRFGEHLASLKMGPGSSLILSIFVVSDALTINMTNFNITHWQYLNILSKLKKELIKRLKVPVQLKFVPNSKWSKKMVTPDIYPNFLLLAGFGLKRDTTALLFVSALTQTRLNQMNGFARYLNVQDSLGNFSLIDDGGCFWRAMTSENIFTLIVNTFDRAFLPRLLDFLPMLPKHFTVLWFFRSQKIRRFYQARLTSFNLLLIEAARSEWSKDGDSKMISNLPSKLPGLQIQLK